MLKEGVPTTTVPDAEVEGSCRIRWDAEIHSAVVPAFISIDCPQHLHHLKQNTEKACVKDRCERACEQRAKQKLTKETLPHKRLLASGH